MLTKQAAAVLDDPKATIAQKLSAVRALQKDTSTSATHVIAKSLLAAPEDLREPCLRALRQRKANTLYEKLLDDAQLPVSERIFAAKVLRFMRDNASEPVLARVLSADDPALRVAAAHSLAVIGVHETMDLVLDALADPSAEVRFFVVTALAGAPDRARVHSALTARKTSETDAAVTSEIDRILRVN